MKALITGADGFVGAHLIAALRASGWEVAATKLRDNRKEENDVSVYQLDILNDQGLRDCLTAVQPDVVYHLAAQSSVADSWQNPARTVDVNIKGSLHLLEALRSEKSHARVLLIGSAEEYGTPVLQEAVLEENLALQPRNIYAVSKVAQNMIGKIYADAYNLDIVMVRAFNHIGPGQSRSFVVPDFCWQIVQMERGLQEPVLKVGNLEAKRDFTDVRDVVRAYQLLAAKGEKKKTYNVGSGSVLSIAQLLSHLLLLARIKIKVVVDQNRLRPLDVPSIQADNSSLVVTTGWQPTIDWRQSLSDTLEYWRRYREEDDHGR